jgi:hypothetical protein
MNELAQMWSGMLRDTANSMIRWTPRILMGLLLTLVAFVVARLLERLLRAFLRRLRFDDLIQKAGLDQALQRIGIRQSIEQFVPRIVYFLLLVLFARTAAQGLGLVVIANAIGAFMAYIPNMVAATLILVIGSAAASWAGTTVTEAAASSGIEFAPSLGRVVTAVLMFVLGVMAANQLRIDTEMIRLVATAVLGGFALAFGLSFGLGSRDVTRAILAGLYARRTFTMGREMEVRGGKGTLEAITPLHTVLQHEGKYIVVANNVYLDEVIRQ